MGSIRFKATDDHVKEMALRAINASLPFGMGLINFKAKNYNLDDIGEVILFDEVNFDYFHGRMVKLYFRRDDDGWWKGLRDPHPEYQSWARAFPTSEALLKACGITEYEKEGE